jgi:hypothetical protein
MSNNTLDNKTHCFIADYNKIVEIFEGIYGRDRDGSFKEKLKEACKKNNYVKKNYMLITSLHELRCVLVHKLGNAIIAIPSDEAISMISEVVENLENPISIYTLFGSQKVETVESVDTLFCCLRTMKHHDYSQLPVYADNEFSGMLSGNIITRYIANCTDDKGEIIEDLNDITVENTLQYAEKSDKAIFVSRDMSIYDFIDKSKNSPSPSGVYMVT